MDIKKENKMYEKFHTWMQSIEHKLVDSKLVKWGFCQNYWGWAHAIEGGIAAKILFYVALAIWAPTVIAALWLPAVLIIKAVILIMVFLGAHLWERIEEKMEAPDDAGKIKIYKSVERWYFDGRGDIWLAVITAFLVLI